MKLKTIGIWIILATIISGYVSASDSLVTVKQYRSRVYELLSCDTTGTSVLDTGLVRRYVQDGVIRAYTDVGIAKSKKMKLTRGTASYLVDAGLTWIKGITLDTNGDFAAMKEIQVSKLSDESYYSTLVGKGSRPEFFIRHGDSIRIYPTPQGTDSLYIFYFARDAFPPADTTTILVPIEYRYAVLYASTSLCAIRMGRFDLYSIFENAYNQEVQRLRTKFEIEGIDEIPNK